ncbi:MAG: nuclear transport factor 2 family protein [Hyphomicrobiaceae bacterium]|nr:nuclear transport factor 2 family protein [Hyphomicrobiaceae bacterium]
MREDALASIDGLITALALQDTEAALAYFDDAAVYVLATDPQLASAGGAYHGKAELRQMMQRLRAEWQVLRWDVDPLLEGEEAVCANVTYRLRHRDTGHELVDRRRYVFRTRGRLVEHCIETLDNSRLRAFLMFAYWTD